MYRSKILVSIINVIKKKGSIKTWQTPASFSSVNCKMGYSYLHDEETSINRELTLALNIVKNKKIKK